LVFFFTPVNNELSLPIRVTFPEVLFCGLRRSGKAGEEKHAALAEWKRGDSGKSIYSPVEQGKAKVPLEHLGKPRIRRGPGNKE
jgi:hypothetical protein